MARKISRKGLTKKLDNVFSLLIRAEGKCQWPGCDTGHQLHCAHIITRSNRRLRWDEHNALALCASHHRQGHDDPLAFAEFVKREFPEKYEYVVKHKQEIVRRTDEELKELLADLNWKLDVAANKKERAT